MNRNSLWSQPRSPSLIIDLPMKRHEIKGLDVTFPASMELCIKDPLIKKINNMSASLDRLHFAVYFMKFG
jgi:hypothetical protein